ncbi:thioredoxin fold domain-containing protein [Arcobacter sp. CECT 8985]|uniref:thioredoxin fold domain-containing protein n=1 Tax=Arcobacter sp. CECT 8985 TaxID=1935424 RepID=UPI00100A24D3|nr:thioredoxin fold domain-containing protein [Arcobacter sp. CECT 8985]RXJ87531.1 hypothetical protein CRU93_03065 [Arcobacter sp. CECT 8985]
MKNLIFLTIFAILFSFGIYYNENYFFEKKPSKKEIEKKEKKISVIDKKVQSIFKNNSKIILDKKDSIIFFTNDKSNKSTKLKEILLSSKELQNKLKINVNAYYIDTSKKQSHIIDYEDKQLKIDTQTMTSLYNIDTTPTLIFLDMHNYEIFSLTGLISKEQLISTLEFIKNRLYKNKDRKSGEVYNSLIEYYKKNNITIKSFIK